MKIAIAGYGIEGKANYAYWDTPENKLTIVDEREIIEDLPENTETILGENAFSQLQDFNLVVRSAGVAPYKIKTDGKIWSSTNEFFKQCPASIIGVTGTKGKGTTSSLIAEILKASGKKVHLVGNIGVPALTELSKISKEDLVIYELSSFQLWDIKYSPRIALLLGVEPDHLNVHQDIDDYYNAKANIFRWQNVEDVAICHPSNQISKKLFDIYDAAKNRLYYANKQGGGVYVDSGWFCVGDIKLIETSNLQLPGEHNVENACAALTVAWKMNINLQAMSEGLRNFKGLEHRLETVDVIDNIQYVNDSFSSAPSATIAAIRSYTAPKVVIIGGRDKGFDFSNLANELKNTKSIRKVLLIGESRHAIEEVLRQYGVDGVELIDASTMESIVKIAKARALSGDVVLLSPGSASFDMFDNFYDRGNQFKREVLKL